MEENNIKQLDLKECWERIAIQKKIYFIALPIVFIISCFLVICIPRTYNCTVKLAPETSTSSMGGIGAVASSFGLDIGKALNSTDAISPELYPDMVSSMNFRISLFNTKISTNDGVYHGTYYEYIQKHQKSAWWTKIFGVIEKLFVGKKNKEPIKKLNPFKLTKEQIEVANAIDANINCSVDKKTDVITITVTDQDPLVCATIADSVQTNIQRFIIEYRTKKAKNDLHYIENLYKNAKESYEKARRTYGAYGDTNEDLVLSSYRLKSEDLENQMQLKFNNYTALSTQLQAAKAKVQERTPAFTILQTPYVPYKPSGPKRMVLVLAYMILATFCITIYAITRKEK